MKVVLLAGGKKGTHATRWANGLSERGIDVHLITQQRVAFNINPEVSLYVLPYTGQLGYFLNAFRLRRLIRKISPDIINVHYASGYGTLARIAGIRPTLLSVWGSDVYDFPFESKVKMGLVRKNIRFATALASTSNSMAAHVKEKIDRTHDAFITPFGVDVGFFKPFDIDCPGNETREIVIGTVKTLSDKYGIDTLMRAFALVKGRLSEQVSLRLEITGDGDERDNLEKLAKSLGIEEDITFHGFVTHDEVLRNLRKLDIYVALSRLDSESFGVALLEASACELPLVVSDVSGPAEVVVDGVTGFIVPRNDHVSAADKIQMLIADPELRKATGRRGRKHVLENYTWAYSVEKMIAVYEKVIEAVKR